MTAVGSANKILTIKEGNTDLNTVKAKVKNIIINLEGIVGYKTYKINNDLWHITMWMQIQRKSSNDRNGS